MKKAVLLSILALGLTACSGGSSESEQNDPKNLTPDQVATNYANNQLAEDERKIIDLIKVGDKMIKCYHSGEIGVRTGVILPAAVRRNLLTLEAQAAGIDVRRSGSDVNSYGTITLDYTNAADTCVIWTESISLENYLERLGQSPLGISPFYEVPNQKPVETPVENKPTK